MTFMNSGMKPCVFLSSTVASVQLTIESEHGCPELWTAASYQNNDHNKNRSFQGKQKLRDSKLVILDILKARIGKKVSKKSVQTSWNRNLELESYLLRARIK